MDTSSSSLVQHTANGLQGHHNHVASNSNNDNQLICKYKEPTHDLADAKILPCGETVCANCVKSSLDSNESLKFECQLCKNEHFLKDIIPNKLVNSLLENKKVCTTKETKALEALKKLTKELIEKFDYKDELLSKVVQYAKEDVSLKIESLKIELDKLENNIFRELCEIEEQFQW